MIPLQELLLFVTASAVLAIAPGPDNLFVLTQSALQGARAGVCVTLGLCTGLLVHIGAVVLGVAAFVQSSAAAFTVLKLVGAVYLLYLAWHAFRAGRVPLAVVDRPPVYGALALYVRGVLMNVSNPKVAIFFLAFLPQFADPSRGAMPAQIVVLGVSFLLTALCIFALVAWTAGRLGRRLQRSAGAQRWMNRLVGTTFAALAVRLLVSRP